ncbi:hypothetical protein OBBRIDRAFT_800614 [Obba rivulosa]|uniref:Uncharacterized protein n=1 Tax=Obba rivulosa TaxID=1052685 RepID=A0A8E2DTP2_9APHY|nr:hypothetical protein OBBRIDRAFT_800614 [Obba rivulosa]
MYAGPNAMESQRLSKCVFSVQDRDASTAHISENASQRGRSAWWKTPHAHDAAAYEMTHVKYAYAGHEGPLRGIRTPNMARQDPELREHESLGAPSMAVWKLDIGNVNGIPMPHSLPEGFCSDKVLARHVDTIAAEDHVGRAVHIARTRRGDGSHGPVDLHPEHTPHFSATAAAVHFTHGPAKVSPTKAFLNTRARVRVLSMYDHLHPTTKQQNLRTGGIGMHRARHVALATAAGQILASSDLNECKCEPPTDSPTAAEIAG